MNVLSLVLTEENDSNDRRENVRFKPRPALASNSNDQKQNERFKTTL